MPALKGTPVKTRPAGEQTSADICTYLQMAKSRCFFRSVKKMRQNKIQISSFLKSFPNGNILAKLKEFLVSVSVNTGDIYPGMIMIFNSSWLAGEHQPLVLTSTRNKRNLSEGIPFWVFFNIPLHWR